MKLPSAYHEVPAEWSATRVIETYARLANSFHVHTPSDLAIRVVHPFIQSKHALYRLSDAVKSQDQAAIWLSAQFLASDVYFSGSGYLKSSIARRLKSAALDEQTRDIVRQGALSLWREGMYRQEWREYRALLRRVGLGPYRKQFASIVALCHPGTRRYVRELLNADNAT
jgi:hypothetical protein